MEELLPHRGNYKKLYSYQKANAIYCLTYYFVEHYIRYNDRTKDQMLQAARSGKQNIIEGCAASVTSAKTEIRLLNVAKASLQELIEDFEDYLRNAFFISLPPNNSYDMKTSIVARETEIRQLDSL